MQGRHGLGDDVRHAEILHLHHHQQARLDVFPDRDHGHIRRVHARLTQRPDVGGVDLQRVGGQLADLADAVLVVVEADHVLPQ